MGGQFLSSPNLDIAMDGTGWLKETYPTLLTLFPM